MKRLVTASVLALVGGFGACAVEDPVPPEVAGTGGAGLGGTAPTGGTNTGGAAPTGGTGTGGTAQTGGTGTGGAAPTGGTNTGGTAPTGGTGGASGTGGAPMGGTGGSMGGMAGMAGTLMGGSAGMPMGGMAGTGAGAGGTSAVPTIQQLVNNLDGHLIITPCGDTPNADDCAGGGWRSNAVNNGANNACANGRLEAVIPFPIGGVAGTEYNVTMHFYGVMEPRQYSSVMREATGATNRTGGTPTGWATAAGNASVYTSGDNNYNTYEIFVYDQNDMRVAQYFLNSDSGTGHYTMLTNYEKTITVIGGGEVRLRVYDANCRMIKNCGENGGTPCSGKARMVSIAAAMPQPTGMPMLQQPALGASSPEHSGQWWLIDVTQVALKPPI